MIVALFTGSSGIVASDLPPCPSSGYFHNCFGTYIWADGDKYIGEFRDGKRTGQGTYTFGPNSKWAGDKYIGEFRNNKKTGQGTYIFGPNSEWAGDKYIGEHRDSESHGQGTYIWANGDKYVGEWRVGKRTGKGTLTWAHGDKYVGEFRNGDLNGKGTLTWADGDKYIGEWKDDKRHGQGIYSSVNGDKYVGEYRDGKRNGQGVYTFADGTVKEGIFKNGKFQYAQKTPFSRKPSVLGTAFKKLSDEYRKKIQINLKNLGFYKSSIDGLYGKGTAAALTAYNKQNLSGANLTNLQNVQTLLNAVLDLKSAPQIVSDSNSDDTYKVASGSGFYVSSQGHIITNYHVISGCTDMKVHSKGNVLQTIKIAEDRRNDLALLKIPTTPEQVFALSDESPFPLQEIIVAGYPFGDKLSSTLKFTQGIVSSIAGLGNDYSQIQIDAALQPGNSGGPILDEYGNVVAVAVAKLSMKKILEDYGVIPENTNFGVKVSAVKNLMEGNGVPFKSPSTEVISKKDLSKKATDGTAFLSCWMTTAQIENMKNQKVFFSDLR